MDLVELFHLKLVAGSTGGGIGSFGESNDKHYLKQNPRPVIRGAYASSPGLSFF